MHDTTGSMDLDGNPVAITDKHTLKIIRLFYNLNGSGSGGT